MQAESLDHGVCAAGANYCEDVSELFALPEGEMPGVCIIGRCGVRRSCGRRLIDRESAGAAGCGQFARGRGVGDVGGAGESGVWIV